jgi:hypothetical protein
MASEETPDETTAEVGGTYDTLRRLERRLDEASQAAERLVAQAAAEAARAVATGAGSDAPNGHSDPQKAPPAGWQTRSAEGNAAGDGAGGRDLELLAQILQSLRDLIPPELQRRIAEALREVLLALRALIDWYLERVELRRSEPVQVQDIPIV